jgi:hypothetical protein
MTKMKKLYLIVLMFSLALAANSQTLNEIKIVKDTIWKLNKSPFYITNDVIVDTNATLTIEPGSIVILKEKYSELIINGKLNSNGVKFLNSYSKHGDSIWFETKYYSPDDYIKAHEKYENFNYETWFIPGIDYTFFQPHAYDSIGQFSGITVEYLIYSNVAQNNRPGPSHVRVYSKFNILNSDKANINSMFMYTFGFDLSIEKNPNRSFLIPYFGLEFGGLTQKQVGSIVQFTPTFGFYLLSKKNISINIRGGYLYPNKNFEMLQGWFGQAGLNFILW